MFFCVVWSIILCAGMPSILVNILGVVFFVGVSVSGLASLYLGLSNPFTHN